MTTAQIIEVDGIQSVRLPAEFRFPSPTISIRREGEAVILEPLKLTIWPANFFEKVGIDDPAFVRPLQGKAPHNPTITRGTGDWSALSATADDLEGYDFDV